MNLDHSFSGLYPCPKGNERPDDEEVHLPPPGSCIISPYGGNGTGTGFLNHEGRTLENNTIGCCSPPPASILTVPNRILPKSELFGSLFTSAPISSPKEAIPHQAAIAPNKPFTYILRTIGSAFAYVKGLKRAIRAEFNRGEKYTLERNPIARDNSILCGSPLIIGPSTWVGPRPVRVIIALPTCLARGRFWSNVLGSSFTCSPFNCACIAFIA